MRGSSPDRYSSYWRTRLSSPTPLSRERIIRATKGAVRTKSTPVTFGRKAASGRGHRDNVSMATKGLFNYSAADACGESPLNSDPSNLFNEFGFTAIRTSLASYEDKMCLSRGVRLAFLASHQTFSKHTCLRDSPLPSMYSARLLRVVRKVSAASSEKQERVKKQQIPQSKT